MDLTLLSEAASALIERDDAPWLYDALCAAVRLQVNYPVALIGSAAVVDVLRAAAKDDPKMYERVIALVDAKRAGKGKLPLVPVEEDRFDKREYMRDFMDKKRQRLRRAVEIENFLRPERDALKGRSRLDFMDHQAACWKEELDVRIQRAREVSGGPLNHSALTSIRGQFWAWVDEHLDKAEADARQRLRR